MHRMKNWPNLLLNNCEVPDLEKLDDAIDAVLIGLIELKLRDSKELGDEKDRTIEERAMLLKEVEDSEPRDTNSVNDSL